MLDQPPDEQRRYVGEDLVPEDVVEGLINRKVHVTGHWSRRRFYIEDIEAAEADENQKPA